MGAAGSTGRGEANLFNLCSYLIVEEMRRGRSPKDAGMEALRRIQSNTVEKRLLNARGLPNFGISFYVLNAKGEHAGVTLYGSSIKYAVCTENGAQHLTCDALLPGEAGVYGGPSAEFRARQTRCPGLAARDLMPPIPDPGSRLRVRVREPERRTPNVWLVISWARASFHC